MFIDRMVELKRAAVTYLPKQTLKQFLTFFTQVLQKRNMEQKRDARQVLSIHNTFVLRKEACRCPAV